MQFLMGALFLVVISFLFVFVYLGNKSTPKPDGLEDLDIGCGGCKNVACGHHPSQN